MSEVGQKDPATWPTLPRVLGCSQIQIEARLWDLHVEF